MTMPFMMVRLVDKVNPDDVRADALCTKAGDVIDLLPDGWTPRPGEQAMIDAGQWAAVKVTTGTVDDLSAFLVADPGDQINGFLPQRRAFSFGIVQWAAQGKPALPLAAVLALKNAKPPRKDSHVLSKKP